MKNGFQSTRLLHGNNFTKQQADHERTSPLLQQRKLAQENHANMNRLQVSNVNKLSNSKRTMW